MRIGVTKNMDALKAEARDSIDRSANAARLRFFTADSGLAQVYQMKGEEAARFLSLSEPPDSLDDFPLLRVEVGIKVNDAVTLANLWREKNEAARARWIAAAADIERLRMEAKAAVDAATCPAEVKEAGAVTWP